MQARFAKLLKGKPQTQVFDFEGSMEFNGFDHPLLPVITNEMPDEIQLYRWGLLPFWSKDTSFADNTLNARRETLADKHSFKGYIKNRCIVIVDGIYEYQWQDSKGNPNSTGKKRRKFYIHQTDEQPMALAGLWAVNQFGPTFTIITKPAVGLMADIHNSKQRMPFILDPMFEEQWLMGEEVEDIIPDLVAVKV